MRALLLAAFLLTSTIGHSAVAQPAFDLEGLVDRCMEAYGGQSALEAVEGWQQVGKVISPMRGEGVTVRVFAPPDRLRVETRFGDDSGETRILNGDRGWRSGKPVEGPPYVAMVLQAARLALPRVLVEGRDRAQYRGEIERDGRSLHFIELPLREGMRLELEIDAESARITRSRSTTGALVFETAYENFQRIDGVLFAMTETTWAMGQPTGRIELDRIVLDSELRDHIFLP
jgi:hypothetical protein